MSLTSLQAQHNRELIIALRSGEYRQGQHRLVCIYRLGDQLIQECCGTGLAALLAGGKIPLNSEGDPQSAVQFTLNGRETVCVLTMPPEIACEYYGWDSPFGPVIGAHPQIGDRFHKERMVGWNDGGRSFAEIADVMEAWLSREEIVEEAATKEIL